MVADEQRRRLDGPAVFALALAGYLSAACILVLVAGVVATQSLSLVASAYDVLFSRDPHLAAMGFAGNPLPVLLLVPVVAFAPLWPALAQLGFAASLVSALFMAASVYQLYRFLQQCEIGDRLALAIAVLFALHPILLYAAGAGLSEAIVLFFLLLTVRHLAAWLSDSSLSRLVIAGAGLAGAYLTQPQALAAGIGALVLVGAVSWRRAAAPSRGWMAACDVVILGAPLFAAVALWAAATWLMTGDPLAQLFSSYGYVAQRQALHVHSGPLVAHADVTLRQLLALEPALPAVGLLIASALVSQRDWRLLAPIAVLAPILLVMVAGNLLGITLPWMRYFIVGVPLVTLLLAQTLVPRHRANRRGRLSLDLRAALVLLLLVITLPTAVAGMVMPLTGREVADVLRPVLHPGDANQVSIARQAAVYIDRLQPGHGTVLVDSYTGFPIVLASRDPQQFVITSDRDFPLALANPAAFGVRYILVPSPAYVDSLASLDAVNRTYPTLFDSGSGLAELVHRFGGGAGRPEWRLYRVLLPA